MHSCLYQGLVRHTRYRPRRHTFRYSLFQFFLDLDEIEEVLDALPLCSARRPAIVRFRRDEHLGDAGVPLKQAVRDKVKELGGPDIDGRIALLTNLRYFGFGFNPVSFYFCYDSADALQAIVAEVNNTPWGEQHCYLVPVNGKRRFIQHRQDKEFHVSPFMDLDMQYLWTVSHPQQRLIVHIENRQQGERLFDAALAMQRQPLTGRNLAKMLTLFPFMTLKVIGAIYFEALRLWLKKIPYHPHTRNLSRKNKEAPAVANK